MSEENKTPETEEEAVAAEAEAANPTSEELTLLLEDARNKADEHWNQVLRLNAELENTRRRAERDVEGAHKFALERFVNELLPVKDSLEMGLAAGGGEEALAKMKEGMELTLKMLGAAIAKFGVEEVAPLGQPFNPELHQAMTMQNSAEHPANHVMAVLQKGYTLNQRLVRPALVVVSKGAPAEPGAGIDTQA